MIRAEIILRLFVCKIKKDDNLSLSFKNENPRRQR